MELSQDENFKKSYAKYKVIVKKWEKEFVKTNGRVPSKHDIKEASQDVRRAYGRYFHLKSQMLEGALVEELCFSPEKPHSPFGVLPSPKVEEPRDAPALPTVEQIETMVAEKDRVWGDHLNNPKPKPVGPKMRTPVLAASQRLFKSCSFNKRNPRKLVKNDSKLNVSQMSLEDSQNETFYQNTADSQYLKVEAKPDTSAAKLINPIEAMSAPVRKIDSKWVQRCAGALEETTEKPTEKLDEPPSETVYGMRKLPIQKIAVNTVDVISDCIENSESEDEDKIKPIVKKNKLDDSIAIHIETEKKTTKKNGSSKKKEENSKKKTKRKTKKSPVSKDVAVADSDNEIDHLHDATAVELPRFPISASVLKDDDIIDSLAEALSSRQPKSKKKTEVSLSSAEERMQSKIKSGSLNDNFVKINIEKKVYVRGKKTVNYSKMKKQQWKNKKKALNELGPEFPERGIMKCFKCDQAGHMARYCTAHKGKSLLPFDEMEEDEKLKTLKEVESLIDGMEEKKILEENFLFETISNENEPELVPDTFLKLLAAPPDVIEDDSESKVRPLYSLNADGSLPPIPDEVREALRLFGHEEFRQGQSEAVMRILSGKSTLLTLSTGSGKSLCYQLPAYVYARHFKCVTLVVSPLVSLMEDQVVNMPTFVKAACLHTNQTQVQRDKIMELIEDGTIDILLVSPEAVVSGERSAGFGGVLRKLPPVAFVCIDEVHCVSQWSHNFRPSYLTICRVLREKLGVGCILGLTATATRSTIDSIVEHIGIPDGLNGVITNRPVPSNLILTVSKDAQRDRAILELLQSERFTDCQSIIVYCIRRDECERVAGLIRTSLPNYKRVVSESKPSRKRKRFDWLVEAYHAGMSASKRRSVQSAFMNGDLKIVVATVAFGMGINKSDIRAVVHYNMPGSFESYVQEVGRAGRDGLTAHCHAFIDRDGRDKFELLRHIHANSIERHVIRKLLQKVFVPCSCRMIKGSFAGKCSGHEVAFSVDETVRELDVPAENVCTLLCYLELDENKYVKTLSNVYMMCKIVSYAGSSAVLEAARRCPPLAVAIALEKNKNKSLNNLVNFEFCVVDVAAAIGWQSGLVKYHLKNLEWDKSNPDRVKKSTLRVEFHTLGFRVMAPGDLDSTQLDAALDSLYGRTQLQEKTMLCQLHHVSNKLSEVSFVDISECLQSDSARSKSDTLKDSIRDYFTNVIDVDAVPKVPDGNYSEGQIIGDVCGLISAYRDCTFTGRSIARILQGISSPNFPAIVWGRCRFWRAHITVDFHKLTEIAKKQIMLTR